MKSEKKTRSPGGKIARLFILSMAVIFIILLLASFVWFPRTGILPIYKGSWVLFRALFNLLMIIPTLIASLVLLAHTLSGNFLDDSNRSFRSYAVLFILLMMMYTVFLEVLGPRIQSRIETIKYQTRTGQELIDSAYEAEKTEDYRRAHDLLERYRELDDDNEDINRAFDRMKLAIAEEQTETVEETPMADREGQPESNTAANLFLRAKNYLQLGEVYSAYYYAAIAEELGNTEAAGLKEEAWSQISTVRRGTEEEEATLLFSQKAEGISNLSYGNITEAYYLFLELTNTYPTDSEIRNFFEETRLRIEETMFFHDEAAHAISYPGQEDIFFVLRNTDREVSLFYAGAAVMTDGGMYFKNIEIFSLNKETGKPSNHYRVPYGKSMNGSISFECIHRNDPAITFEPESLLSAPFEQPPSRIDLPMPVGDLHNFSSTARKAEILSLGELLRLRNFLPKFGYPAGEMLIEILMRVLYPFIFLVFAFFSLAVGIRTTPERKGFTLAGVLLLPVLPVMIYFIIQFFYFVNRLVLGFVLLWLGFYPALAVLFAMQGLLLVFSIAASYRNMH